MPEQSIITVNEIKKDYILYLLLDFKAESDSIIF